MRIEKETTENKWFKLFLLVADRYTWNERETKFYFLLILSVAIYHDCNFTVLLTPSYHQQQSLTRDDSQQAASQQPTITGCQPSPEFLRDNWFISWLLWRSVEVWCQPPPILSSGDSTSVSIRLSARYNNNKLQNHFQLGYKQWNNQTRSREGQAHEFGIIVKP